MMRISLIMALASAAVALAAQTEEPVLGKKSSEWLTILKEHKEVKWRRASLLALEVFGPRTRGVLPGVIEALAKDPEPQIRREAALLLGRMGPDAKEATGDVAEALKRDKSPLVREAAALALANKLNEFAGEQVLVLAAALQDDHSGTRVAAAEALKNLGDAARLASPQLLAAAKQAKGDRIVRLYAIQLVSRLHENETEKSALLMDIAKNTGEETALRAAAIEGLGRADSLAAAPAELLGMLLAEKAVDLRRSAATALAKHADQTTAIWPQVKKALTDDDSNVRYRLLRVAAAIAPEQKEALGALVEAATNDEHVENRLAAIQELGQLGATAAGTAPDLRKLAASDARAQIRDAAAAALKLIEN